jgi:hypothetical protein
LNGSGWVWNCIVQGLRAIQTLYLHCEAHGAHQWRDRERRRNMRSDLIFGALTHVTNRYQLCQLAAKATRKLHKPNTRLQDTTNEVLDRFKDTIPMEDGVEPTVEKIHVGDHRERRAA